MYDTIKPRATVENTWPLWVYMGLTTAVAICEEDAYPLRFVYGSRASGYTSCSRSRLSRDDNWSSGMELIRFEMHGAGRSDEMG